MADHRRARVLQQVAGMRRARDPSSARTTAHTPAGTSKTKIVAQLISAVESRGKRVQSAVS